MNNLSIINLKEKIKGDYKTIEEFELFEVLGRKLKIPVMTVSGGKIHPILIVAAGVHGDEFEGMEAIRRIYRTLDPSNMNGTFIGIPVCNILAYENQTRESPVYADGLNLARCFPGNPNGSYTLRLAHELYKFVTNALDRESDVFIDLHSAGTRYKFVPVVGFHNTSPKSENLARCFGLKIWKMPSYPKDVFTKTFNGSVSNFGIATLGCETTGRGGLIEKDINSYIQGVLNILNAIGIIEDKSKNGKGKDEPLYTTTFVRVRCGGFFQTKVNLGEKIKKNQKIGSVFDIVGEIKEEVFAPTEGEVWFLRTFSTVQSGDDVFMIAKMINN